MGAGPQFCISHMNIDITLEEPKWASLALVPLAEDAAKATLTLLGINPDHCEISLLACNDARIATLNAEFRDRTGATNVLSWPANDLAAQNEGGMPELPKADFTGGMALGDIAIAWETCEREARTADKPMTEHVTHLIVHGVLHLLGFDHVRDPDATLMMEKEVEILGKLGISNPYKGTDGP